MLELLSYNVQYGQRLNEITEWINKQNADIVCLQEFPEDKVRSNEFEGETIFAYAWEKYGKHYGEAIVYNAKKLVLQESRTVNLGTSSLERKLFKNKATRSALITSFSSQVGDFTVANLHLQPMATTDRRLEQLAAAMEEVGSGKESTLVLGDFNMSSLFGVKKLNSFMGKYGFQNATNDITTHRYKGISHQLDYVFYRLCSISNVHIAKIDLSDHYPIHLTFFPS